MSPTRYHYATLLIFIKDPFSLSLNYFIDILLIFICPYKVKFILRVFSKSMTEQMNISEKRNSCKFYKKKLSIVETKKYMESNFSILNPEEFFHSNNVQKIKARKARSLEQ